MSFIGLTPVEGGRIDEEMTRIERGGELLQGQFLSCALRALEKDDGATAMRDLRQLQLCEMFTKRAKRGIQGWIHAPRLTH